MTATAPDLIPLVPPKAQPLPIAPGEAIPLEHLSPHDLVTYFRCPHEMELHRSQHLSWRTGAPLAPRTPSGTVPLSHSPLFPPPVGDPRPVHGRLDVGPQDTLVYQDPDEPALPFLFPAERSHAHAFLRDHSATLEDRAWALSGRPDYVVRRPDGHFFPVEYKETHLFEDYPRHHGRFFDFLQVLAECRLVEATWGVAPVSGLVYYGDSSGGGEREGWVEVPYAGAPRAWLQTALKLIRADPVRAPVPQEGNCGHCEPNRDGLCAYPKVRFEDVHPSHRGEVPRARRFY